MSDIRNYFDNYKNSNYLTKSSEQQEVINEAVYILDKLGNSNYR